MNPGDTSFWIDALLTGGVLVLTVTAWAQSRTIGILMGQIDQLERHVLTLANRTHFIDEPMRRRLEQQAKDMRPMP